MDWKAGEFYGPVFVYGMKHKFSFRPLKLHLNKIDIIEV
jgi:hypothetical protein